MRETNPLGGTAARLKIAANVRVELARAQVSASQMAQRIGAAQATFARRMTGDVSFSAEEIVAIATELRIPVSALLADVVAPATNVESTASVA